MCVFYHIFIFSYSQQSVSTGRVLHVLTMQRLPRIIHLFAVPRAQQFARPARKRRGGPGQKLAFFARAKNHHGGGGGRLLPAKPRLEADWPDSYPPPSHAPSPTSLYLLFASCFLLSNFSSAFLCGCPTEVCVLPPHCTTTV